MMHVELWHGTPRRVEGDKQIFLSELMFGAARLILGPVDSFIGDIQYDYDSLGEAWAALLEWDPTTEPTGWQRRACRA